MLAMILVEHVIACDLHGRLRSDVVFFSFLVMFGSLGSSWSLQELVVFTLNSVPVLPSFLPEGKSMHIAMLELERAVSPNHHP